MNLSYKLSLPANKYTYCQRRKAFVLRRQVVAEYIYIILAVLLVFAIAISLRMLNLSGVSGTTPEQRLNVLRYWSQLPIKDQALSMAGLGTTGLVYRARAQSDLEDRQAGPVPEEGLSPDRYGSPPPEIVPVLSKEQRAINLLRERYKLEPQLAKTIASAVLKNADELGLEPAIVFGMIHAESTFKPNEFSATGAIGLMQIIPSWHLKLIHEAKSLFGLTTNLFTPEVNIWVGMRIKKQYLQKFNGRLDLALLQYNGSLKDPDKVYYHKVLNGARIFEKELK